MKQVHYLSFPLLNSTQIYAKEHSATFSPDEITCISAEEQTEGRGRLERRWLSPPRLNLYATFFFTLPLTAPSPISLAQVGAWSLASLLQDEGLSPLIKWPNDLQLSHKKVAGLLAEARFLETHTELFLGIGLNVNMEPPLLSQIDQPATSLLQETGRPWDKKALLHNLGTRLSHHLSLFEREGFAPFFRENIEKILAYRGQEITCLDGEHHWRGICDSLSPEGGLRLLLPSGERKTLFSGDIR